jgi:hypothetical protein
MYLVFLAPEGRMVRNKDVLINGSGAVKITRDK